MQWAPGLCAPGVRVRRSAHRAIWPAGPAATSPPSVSTSPMIGPAVAHREATLQSAQNDVRGRLNSRRLRVNAWGAAAAGRTGAAPAGLPRVPDLLKVTGHRHPDAGARKVLGWHKQCKLTHTFSLGAEVRAAGVQRAVVHEDHVPSVARHLHLPRGPAGLPPSPNVHAWVSRS
jgi:hypothetical protein